MTNDTNPTNDVTTIIVETKEISPVFIKKRHELQKTLKLVKEGSASAIKLLQDTVDNKDADLNLRIACAKEIIRTEASLVEQINKDQLHRLIAEVRFNQQKQRKLIEVPNNTKDITNSEEEEEEEDSTPILDFNNIHEV